MEGAAVWDLPALPVLARSDGSIMDWLTDFLESQVPDLMSIDALVCLPHIHFLCKYAILGFILDTAVASNGSPS
jgi:hypothetical protein